MSSQSHMIIISSMCRSGGPENTAIWAIHSTYLSILLNLFKWNAALCVQCTFADDIDITAFFSAQLIDFLKDTSAFVINSPESVTLHSSTTVLDKVMSLNQWHTGVHKRHFGKILCWRPPPPPPRRIVAPFYGKIWIRPVICIHFYVMVMFQFAQWLELILNEAMHWLMSLITDSLVANFREWDWVSWISKTCKSLNKTAVVCMYNSQRFAVLTILSTIEFS